MTLLAFLHFPILDSQLGLPVIQILLCDLPEGADLILQSQPPKTSVSVQTALTFILYKLQTTPLSLQIAFTLSWAQTPQ